jgi:hypothetical protein
MTRIVAAGITASLLAAGAAVALAQQSGGEGYFYCFAAK